MEFIEYKEKAGSCSYCGNSPVPHFPTFVFQSFNVYVGFLYKHFVSWKLYRVITLCLRYIFIWVQRVHYPLAAMMGILSFSNETTKASTYRSQVIWEEAQRRGIKMQQIFVFGKPVDLYRMSIRSQWYYFESIPIPYTFDQSDYAWMDDKFYLKSVLSGLDVQVPRSVSVYSVRGAKKAYASFKGPVVVKPRIGSRARHTFVNVQNEDELVSAFKIARQLCICVVIEDFLEGSVCRATTVQGKLRGFLRAEAPFVVGDGTSTIEQLVQIKNAQRPERVAEIVLTTDHDSHMRRQGCNRKMVLERGRKVTLNLHTGRLFGGETEEYGNAIHPSITQSIEKAAQRLSAPIIGFDVIVNDPLSKQSDGSWGIIEANTLPFIDLHYLPLKGSPTPVAKYVIDLWNS